ncbi:protein kinase [bacterium]|nr:protein kinase [bacterium]
MSRKRSRISIAREADTLAQLKHPAIPAISDRFDDQNRHYLVMEYVEGRNLEEELAARGGPFPESLVVDVARQLCDVLAYLHGLQPPIIYRDMKPSNVMLTGKGRVVLIDFGIARLFKGSRKGTMIGTLGFAPPEQYQGVADPRSDIYSLGATLHYVLTGRDPENYPPFSFPPVRDLRPETSRNVAGAIDRALAYEMDARPATIQEFRDMLLYGAGLAADGSRRVSARGGTADLSEAAAPSRPRPKTVRRAPTIRPRRRKGRWIGLAAFCVITAGAAFGATYVYRNPALQQQLGLSQFINNLPWKREERMAYARAHPLSFQNASLELSTRAGDAISRPRLIFTDTELANAQYLAAAARTNPRPASPSTTPGAPPLSPNRASGHPPALPPIAAQNGRAAPARATARLVATTEAREFPIYGERAIIGRSAGAADRPDVDLAALARGADRVSRRHAEIVRRGLEYFIRDLGSLNGTYIVGRGRLGRDQLYQLRDRDEVVLGSAKLVFRRG